MSPHYSQIVSDISRQKFSSVYFLYGEEPFFIDKIVQLVSQHSLEESEKSFNLTFFYGKETSLDTIIDVARKFPMMGTRQVLIVKEAQAITDWKKESTIQKLHNYFIHPTTTTLLVFAYKKKTFDKRSKLWKALSSHTVLESKRVYENKLHEFISDYCKNKEIKIEPTASMILIENIGANLKLITDEIDKLALVIEDSKSITKEAIQKYVGISREYNVFELSNAVGERNIQKAIKIIHYLSLNMAENSPFLVIGSLYNYFSKLILVKKANTHDQQSLASLIGIPPFFVKDYLKSVTKYRLDTLKRNITYLQQADLALKGIGVAKISEQSILRELVYKLLKSD